MDYLIENQTNIDKTFEPGSISNTNLILRNLKNSTIKVFNFNKSLKILSCHNCKLIISALSGLCEIENTENCTISSASNEVNIENSKNLTLFLFTETDPVIKNSTNLKFAPYNIKFSGQDSCFAEAELNSYKDKWSEVHDLNRNSQYELMDPKEFFEESFEFEGLGEICNPVPRHIHYGGNLKYEIIPYSKTHSYTKERRDLPPSSKIIHSQFDLRKDVPYTRPISKIDSEPIGELCVTKRKINLKIEYLGKKGFEFKGTQVDSATKLCIEGCLKEFQVVLDRFYEVKGEYFLAFFFSVVGMLIILLVLQILRMSSEWLEASVACFLIILAISEVVIISLLITKLKSANTYYSLMVDEFNIRVAKKFEDINAEFVGTLKYVEVYINEV